MPTNNKEAPSPYPFPYKLGRHAGNTPAEEFFENPELGGNCERTAYFIAQILGHEPPPDGTRPYELFSDDNIGSIIDEDEAKTGDIIFFLRPDRAITRGLHVGLAWSRNNSPLHVLHNARHIGSLVTQELSEVMKYPHHSSVAGIKRLNPEPLNFNPDMLIRYNLTFLLEGAKYDS